MRLKLDLKKYFHLLPPLKTEFSAAGLKTFQPPSKNFPALLMPATPTKLHQIFWSKTHKRSRENFSSWKMLFFDRKFIQLWNFFRNPTKNWWKLPSKSYVANYLLRICFTFKSRTHFIVSYIKLEISVW